ncbi:hypothetical protein AB205_0052650, partial [Aquarana catesbeiana]
LCAATSRCRPFLVYLFKYIKYSMSGSGAHLSFFSAVGRVEPQHAEALVEWMTKPSSSSSSSSSSVTQAQSTLAAKAAYSIGSMSSVTPSLAPPSCPEESPELFDHSVVYMLQEDAQSFEGSDDGTRIEEGSNVSPERGGAQEGQQTDSHVPPAAAYCQSQANKRGQAGFVSKGNSAGCGDGASSSAPGHVEPQHAEDLVEWMTKPSSSSSSSHPGSGYFGKAAANTASSLGSMASVTPSLALPCPPKEFPELFDHSVLYMFQEDTQRFEGSDDGTQLDEGSNVSPERGGAQEGQQSGSHVPPAAAYCQVCSSDEEGGDDEVTDSTWVPHRREEEEEEHHQRGRMPSRGQPKGSTPTASHPKAPHVQGATVSSRYSKSSLVWAFFEMSASDPSAAICNVCLKRISRGQNISRLGSTCLTRHMLTCHTVPWQAYLKDPHQRTKRTSPLLLIS